MNSPSFSCVIPVKGPRPYFTEAVASLQDQGLGDDLEIIVQDGDINPDAGQSDALNKGFSKAKGEWLFWLNSDDILLPGALGKVREFINHVERVDWIAGDTVYIDEQGIIKDVRTDAKWRSWFGGKMSVWTGGPSAFFRRSLWERLGGFDTSLKYVMDIDLWTRWAKEGARFEGIGDYVWGFRWYDGSATASGNNTAAHVEEKQKLLSRYGIKHPCVWRNLTRVASFLDGTWLKRQHNSKSFRGTYWRNLEK